MVRVPLSRVEIISLFELLSQEIVTSLHVEIGYFCQSAIADLILDYHLDLPLFCIKPKRSAMTYGWNVLLLNKVIMMIMTPCNLWNITSFPVVIFVFPSFWVPYWSFWCRMISVSKREIGWLSDQKNCLMVLNL